MNEQNMFLVNDMEIPSHYHVLCDLLNCLVIFGVSFLAFLI